MESLIISDIQIDLIRKDIKNIHLTVYPPAGRVRISAPRHLDDETIRLFLVSKLPWIRKQQRQLQGQDRQSPREYINRESHYYQGKRYLLNVIEHDAPPKVVIRNKTYIDMYVRKNSTTEQRNAIMNEWYRAHLKDVIPGMIKKWEPILGVSANDWGVKLMKRKWGSCNIKEKRIWLNLELAKKPVYCLEYVVVHELLHLIERHHNEYFYTLLEKYIPQWKQYRKELNTLPVSHVDWDY